MIIRGSIFPLGQTVITPGAARHLAEAGTAPATLLKRHARGDWGNVCAEDNQANDTALNVGLRLLSSYPINGENVWVITEADRSVTTILLPEEY